MVMTKRCRGGDNGDLTHLWSNVHSHHLPGATLSGARIRTNKLRNIALALIFHTVFFLFPVIEFQNSTCPFLEILAGAWFVLGGLEDPLVVGAAVLGDGAVRNPSRYDTSSEENLHR